MTQSMSVETTFDSDDVRAAASRWWVLAIIGLVTALLGLRIVTRPEVGEVVLVLLISLGFILSGIGDMVTSGRWPKPWVPVAWGVVSLGAGIVTFMWPDITLTALAIVVGIVLILRGLVAVAGSLAVRPPVWGLWLVIGVVELAAGVAAIAWPSITIVVIAIIIGIDLLIAGLVELAVAFRLRSLA